MSDSVFLKGIVLKSEPYSESDKRLVILTGERGLITAFAKGARRARSPLSASTECFVYATFECFEGRSAYTLVRTKVHEYFREITQSFDKVALGYYLLELCSYYAVENSPEKEMLNLLYLSISALINNKNESLNTDGYVYATDIPMIRIIFELRVMVIFGEYPAIDESTVYYDIKECEKIDEKRSADANVLTLTKSDNYAIRYIQFIDLKKLYTGSEPLRCMRRLKKSKEAGDMKKRLKAILIMAAACAFTFGCAGSMDFDADEDTVFVTKSGEIKGYIQSDFTENWYDQSELMNFIE